MHSSCGSPDRSSTKQVKVRTTAPAGEKGRPATFEMMIVTEDEVRHSLPVPNDQMAALVALTQAASVLLWDPEDNTLIAANLVGEWIPTSFSTLKAQ